MRKIMYLFLCIVMASGHLWAQNLTLSGKVTDEKDGSPLSGVSIATKDGKVGVKTSVDGSYSISLPSKMPLIFSYIGYQTIEITPGNASTFNLKMKSADIPMVDVVVTALGITKDRRTLGYAPQVIKAEQLEDRGDNNLLNLLQGKVAGADITGASGSAGSSTNIILRGMTSVNGSNQPLFVVDGIPISNDLDQTTSTLYGTQPANRALDLNPNNIESLTVLPGPAAAVLYGSRASSGAIIITTKKGSGKKGVVNVTVNSSYTQKKVYGFPELQNQYGQGTAGVFSSTSTSSFGPAFGSTPSLSNGLIVATGTTPVVNGVTYAAGNVIPYQPYSDNIINFFETGESFDNNITMNGGDAKNNFALSLGNSRETGIMPNTNFKKTNIQFTSTAQLTDKLSLFGTATYFNNSQLGITQGNGGNSAMFGLWGVTRSTNFEYYKNNYKKADGTNNWWVAGRDNPYFAAYENPINSNLSRVLGNIRMSYDAASWLNVSYRLGVDAYTDRRKRIVAFSSSQATGGTGRVTEDLFYRSELNGDLLVNAKKNNLFGSKINASLLLGQNINQRIYQNSYVTALGLTIPGFYNASNGTDFKSSGEYSSKRRLVGYFGQLSLGYNNYLNLELTARADQSSTLPTSNNSYLYYSASGSFVFTEAFNLKNSILSFGKVRAAYAKVGKDANVYKLENSYQSWSYGNNVASFAFPYGTTSGFGVNSTIPNNNLTPEFTTSFEIGTNLGFWRDRVTLDATYYTGNSTDQIIDVAIPVSTGYDTKTTNVGKITNKGVEVTLTVIPVKTRNFQWTVSGNFSKNKSKVVSLADGVTSMVLPGNYFGGVAPSAVVGSPYGVIVGSTIPRSPDGKFLIDSTTGAFQTSITNQIVADPNRKWIAGLSNTFKYKNFSLSVLVDYKHGGDILSWTIATLRSNGSLKETGENRDQPHILPGVIKINDKTFIPNNIQIPAQTYWANLGGIGGGELAVFDASTFRIREVSVSYSIPTGRLNGKFLKGATLTMFGRNLFFYAPNSLIDPEISTQGAGNIRGMELQSAPNTRNMGASLRLNF